jgi:2,3-bisphosphoglycerate-independent phosphoglycerate mutase
MAKPELVILTVLDGWGESRHVEGNAVKAAHKPVFDRLWAENPHTFIEASGPWVGLPKGQMGNSEVGHLNIGSGRIIQMDVTRIDVAIETGAIEQNPALAGMMTGDRLHLMGLVSDGGVHSMNTHLYALLAMAKKKGVKEVFVHAFLDGRDTPPQSGVLYMRELLAKMAELGIGKLASVCGRYYAMDRDKRWERVEQAFTAMTAKAPHTASDAIAAIEASYAAGVTDEFFLPVTMVDAGGEAVGAFADGDAAIFFNYRADRAREITERLMKDSTRRIAMMTQYDRKWDYPCAFHPESHANVLGEVLSNAGVTNLRVAETEKYPHVTFFFNGGVETPFAGEAREMAPSPKVATYDLMPEMNAAGVRDAVLKSIREKAHGVIIVNFANPDMVGHSGSFAAAKKAVETVDACLGELAAALKEHGSFAWIITADHGNAETMVDPMTHGVHTYHTTNPVPLILVGAGTVKMRDGGSLRDLAPTVLALLEIPQPKEMTGADLRSV